MSLDVLLLIILKVIVASSTMVLLFISTPYVKLFSRLDKIFPKFLVTALFLTYRSIFILWGSLEDIRQAIYLRGGLSIKNPARSLMVLGNSLGFLVVKSIESSEKMYEGMRLRGHNNEIRYLEEKNG
jgi:cobalt/nickel transport system permease protein